MIVQRTGLASALVRVEGNVRSERLGDRPQHAWEYGALYVLWRYLGGKILRKMPRTGARWCGDLVENAGMNRVSVTQEDISESREDGGGW